MAVEVQAKGGITQGSSFEVGTEKKWGLGKKTYKKWMKNI